MTLKRALLGGVVALILLVLASAFVAYTTYKKQVHAPIGAEAQSWVFTINAGEALGKVASRLNSAGIYTKPNVLLWRARERGIAEAMQVGEYQLNGSQSVDAILTQFNQGKVLQYTVTFLEGWTTHEMLQALHAHEAVKKTLTWDTLPTLLKDLPEQERYPEGWFYPDTYSFVRGASDASILNQAHAHMLNALNAAWQQATPQTILKTRYELLTLASMVEKETQVEREKPVVAGVFYNRLKKRMRLQTDPTVIYGLGKSYKGNLTRKHLSTDTPYNTYTRYGLPPTPIALPTKSSLTAAIRPADTQAYYFVASPKLDGTHTFSNTLREHNLAVAHYVTAYKKKYPK